MTDEQPIRKQCRSFNHYLNLRCELESGHKGRHRSPEDALSWPNRAKNAYPQNPTEGE